MLIHALFDNKTELGDGLKYQLYNGYFNGTDALPNTTWFDTAELLASGTTTDLSSLATATNNTFQQNFNDTEAMYDNWNMTGYTYTASTDLTITTRTANNLRLTMTNSTDPQLNLEGTRPAIDTATYNYIHLRYKLVSGSADALVFFFYNTSAAADKYAVFNYNNVGSGGYPGVVKVNNYEDTITGKWYNIVFNMSTHPNWTAGNWAKFRLDPITGDSAKTAVIDFEYFVISNSPNPPDYNYKSLKLSGAFRAKKTGVYRFFTRSDDASFLYIDGILTVSNGGSHAAQNRFGNVSLVAGSYYQFIIYYGDSTAGQEFSAGYLEPLDDGTTSGSTNVNNFITNGTGLTVYFQNNYTSGGGPFFTSYIYNNPSLYGRFKIDIIGLYVERTNFSTGKDDLLYLISNQLYSPGSGSRFLVLHEEPVSSDFVRKDHHYFSDNFEIVCQLNGFIEISFKRGVNSNVTFQRLLLVMQADPIDD